ncbi:MAG: 50S ribosomal protein L6 [Holosporales bacterium]
MSRVGKNEVKIPNSVTLTINGRMATVKGKLGERSYEIPEVISFEKTETGLLLKPINEAQQTRALWGTANRTLSAMVKGVDQGFTVNIDLVGVGYRTQVQGSKIVLQLGFSHDIEYVVPQGITVKSEKPTSLSISGPCAQQIGQIAAELRKYRKPEPYKGKGVIRSGEYVLRKEGKKK